MKRCIICGGEIEGTTMAYLDLHPAHMNCWTSMIPKCKVNQTFGEAAERHKVMDLMAKELIKAYENDPLREGESECQKCGEIYTGRPALSRADNKTQICPKCGIFEALDAWEKSKPR